MSTQFDLPRLILCEGPEDQTFLGQLIISRGLTNWHIRHPGKSRSKPGGNSKFGEYIRSVRLSRDRFEIIKRLVIVTDADLDPDLSFKKVQEQLEFADLAPPMKPNHPSDGTPRTTIMLMPQVGKGCLETVCIEAVAAQAKPITKDHVDRFVASVTDGDWTDVQKSKLWLGAMIAASWQRDPGIQIAPLLLSQKPEKPIIPLKHRCFDWIADRLEAWAK
jgi:hypothetical protein